MEAGKIFRMIVEQRPPKIAVLQNQLSVPQAFNIWTPLAFAKYEFNLNYSWFDAMPHFYLMGSNHTVGM